MIPSDPGYQSILPQNQVCPVTGSTPGTNLVSGDRYIELSFDYHYSHLWRNYGILIGYFMFFLALYGLAVEFVPQVVKGKGDILIFLRHGKRKAGSNKISEKKTLESDTNNAAHLASSDANGPRKRSGFGKLKRSQDSFTWDKIEYQIPVKGGMKTLLTGIHGFVKPGSMTGRC
jgi:ATP-binding cassette, subfamily G (WHITE), member 2, SNQ2